MFRVRHYDQMIHPGHFKEGVLGLTIRALNWVRWKLEIVVQGLVVKYLARVGGVPKERVGTMTRMFKLDVEAERLEKERTSPNLPEAIEVEVPRADRYADGGGAMRTTLRVAEQVENQMPVRPLPADEMIARYMDPKRAKYARGRNFTIVADENDFEPVVKG